MIDGIIFARVEIKCVVCAALSFYVHNYIIIYSSYVDNLYSSFSCQKR